MRHTLFLTVQFVGIANLVSGEINQPETQVWKPNLAHPLPSFLSSSFAAVIFSPRCLGNSFQFPISGRPVP